MYEALHSFNILNATQRRDYFNCIQVFKCLNNTAPAYMSDMLHSPGEFNSYVTRNSNDSCGKLYVRKPRLELFRQGFQNNGPVTYNNLPQNIKESNSIQCFKSKLKNHILCTVV